MAALQVVIPALVLFCSAFCPFDRRSVAIIFRAGIGTGIFEISCTYFNVMQKFVHY